MAVLAERLEDVRLDRVEGGLQWTARAARAHEAVARAARRQRATREWRGETPRRREPIGCAHDRPRCDVWPLSARHHARRFKSEKSGLACVAYPRRFAARHGASGSTSVIIA